MKMTKFFGHNQNSNPVSGPSVFVQLCYFLKYFSIRRDGAIAACWLQLDVCLSWGGGFWSRLVREDKDDQRFFVQFRFATPFVQITCQDTGAFNPPEWDGFNCVLRKIVKFLLNFVVNTCAMSPRLLSFSATTTECFDCTTTSKWNDNPIEHYRNTKVRCFTIVVLLIVIWLCALCFSSFHFKWFWGFRQKLQGVFRKNSGFWLFLTYENPVIKTPIRKYCYQLPHGLNIRGQNGQIFTPQKNSGLI